MMPHGQKHAAAGRVLRIRREGEPSERLVQPRPAERAHAVRGRAGLGDARAQGIVLEAQRLVEAGRRAPNEQEPRQRRALTEVLGQGAVARRWVR